MRRKWYQVDNVGKFYSFTNKNLVPAVFRYSVSLRKDIDKEILQQALNESLKLFPNFNCHLKKGLFWYYLESTLNEVEVTEENQKICCKIYRDEEDVLIRVNYYKKRINLEVSHILSDGRGSLSFFKCLIYKYLMLKEKVENIDIESDASIYEKNEDSFDKYYKRQKYRLPKIRKIYQYKGKKKDDITYIEYHLSVKKVLELAHQYHVSLTSLLIAVLVCSYQKQMKETDYNKTIKIDVPVDLRSFFPSPTARNFFGLTSVTYQFESRDYQFRDVVQSVHQQLKRKTTLEELTPRMNQMISFEKNILARFVPIFVKDFVLKIIDLATMAGCTSCVSNIGKITVDERLEKFIDGFSILNTTGQLKLTICSYDDDLSIGISSKYVSNDIIKDFCRFFSKKGINGYININQEEENAQM